MSPINLDESAIQALKWIDEGDNVFVTGKAGTGKTTLLKHIVNKYIGKKYVEVVAPTGIAAENAGGTTIHSFLRVPIAPYLPDHTNKDLYKLSDRTAKVVEALDILIIDEISMVRCDLLDAIDDILRYYRKNDLPFGGVQIVMFGTLMMKMMVISHLFLDVTSRL